LGENIREASFIKRGCFPGRAVCDGDSSSAEIWGKGWRGKQIWGDVGLMEVEIGKTGGRHVWLKKECVTNGGGQVVDKLGGESHEVRREEEEGFFVLGVDEAEAVRMNGVKVSKILKLLVGLGNDVVFLVVGGKFRDFCQATMDVDGAGGLRCREQDRPCLVGVATDEESFCFLRVVLKECRVEAKIFLE
jgi:hypothetical protein